MKRKHKEPLASPLSSFVRKLCNTVANSAAAERAFSEMNSQHTKPRNRLEPEGVGKLLYMKINQRRLRDEEPPPATVTEDALLEDESEEMERIIQRQKKKKKKFMYGSMETPLATPTPTASEI